ncbi:hypothetical protein K443DRAFT_115999, partial [Laccaria amethystina LaAM-08-1]
IPTRSLNTLHKTVYETVEPQLLWPVLGDLGLLQIPSHSVKTLHKTVYKTVELLWR